MSKLSSPTPSRALISRRRLIQGGVAVAAAGVLGVGVLASLEQPAAGLMVLGQHERALVHALGEALFPPGNPIGPSFQEIGGTQLVDALLHDGMHPRSVKPLRYALKGVDLAARLSLGAPIAELPASDRLLLLHDWAQAQNTLRRAAMDGIKSLLAMAYFNHPQVMSAVGFQSRCYPEL